VRPLYSRVMAYRAIRLDDLSWEERDRTADEQPRWHAPVTDALKLAQSRARMWRYSPGARGRRHKDLVQEEVFVVLARFFAYGAPPEQGGAEFLPDIA
jgi:hypothetical protein